MSLHRLITLLLAAWMATASPLALGQEVLREVEATGTRLGRPIATNNSLYPLTKKWEDFSAAEKAGFRSFYANLGETDEPPFPAIGMTNILREVSYIASRTGYTGELRLHVLVGVDGKAKSVSFLRATNIEAAKSIAKAFVSAAYKPGVCAGSPCEMAFPFYTVIDLQ